MTWENQSYKKEEIRDVIDIQINWSSMHGWLRWLTHQSGQKFDEQVKEYNTLTKDVEFQNVFVQHLSLQHYG